MKNILLLLLALSTLACSENKRQETAQTTIENKPDTLKTDTVVSTPPAPAPTQLPAAETHHIFSHPTEPDHFKLEFQDTNLLQSFARFTITNPHGEIIYQDSLSAGDLEASMVYEMKMPIATADERVEFIRKRVKEFFDEKHFSTPAVAPNDSYDQTFGDETTWQTIKNDKNAVGFSYLIGKEYGRRIAYSKLKNKVMVVGYFGG